ncbi:unnamed protein product [Linum tenue]|uniref:Uncharacterized protein n=1 Tax=Linum tenue TaxID=586396 RepID=A0AAV0J8K4_9ROSI|nr:unnamed protein product [Linum tenue]CAI0406179.1 unnamed protein product [Linum tenue]
MNPLTLVKRIQSINSKEAALGISEEASWHAKYRDSAYVFVGGIPFDLTEGDLLAVFAQYGEVVDVNLVRDKGTGKSKGFAFIAYEDQRSTNLAVDNLNGAQVLGRVIRVDHVTSYKKREEEDEETAQKNREARGVCRAFQKGECTRGAGCKFSHDEQRAANTGWGAQDRSPRWGQDKFDGPQKGEEEDEETERKKRAARGVCYAFQKGECTRGARCKFSHDDQRAANMDRGAEDKSPKRGYDKFDGPKKREKVVDERSSGRNSRLSDLREEGRRSRNYDDYGSGPQSGEDQRTVRPRDSLYEKRSREDVHRRDEKRLKRDEDDEKSTRRHESDDFKAKSRSMKTHEGGYGGEEKSFRRQNSDELGSRSMEDDNRRHEKTSRGNESKYYARDDRDKKRDEKRSARGMDSSSDRDKRDDHRNR